MTDLSTIYVQQFTKNYELLAQQKGSRLLPFIKTGQHTGESAAAVDQYGLVNSTEKTERYAILNPQTVPLDRRWVSPTTMEYMTLLDNHEQLKSLQSPTSPIVEAAVADLARKMDDQIIAAFWAASATGVAATTTTTAFPSTQQVLQTVGSGGSASGLNMAKIKKAASMFITNDVLDEQLYIALNGIQHDYLMNEYQATDATNKISATIVDGKFTSVMGMQVVISNRLVTDGTYTRVPVWAKSGMYWGDWQQLKTSVEKDITRSSHPIQVYASYMGGATRLQEKKVVEIKCVAT